LLQKQHVVFALCRAEVVNMSVDLFFVTRHAVTDGGNIRAGAIISSLKPAETSKTSTIIIRIEVIYL
jgi:hypothetical protein